MAVSAQDLSLLPILYFAAVPVSLPLSLPFNNTKTNHGVKKWDNLDSYSILMDLPSLSVFGGFSFLLKCEIGGFPRRGPFSLQQLDGGLCLDQGAPELEACCNISCFRTGDLGTQSLIITIFSTSRPEKAAFCLHSFTLHREVVKHPKHNSGLVLKISASLFFPGPCGETLSFPIALPPSSVHYRQGTER